MGSRLGVGGGFRGILPALRRWDVAVRNPQESDGTYKLYESRIQYCDKLKGRLHTQRVGQPPGVTEPLSAALDGGREVRTMACACEKDRGQGNKCAHCKEGNHKCCSSFGSCS